ncbi:MAG: formate dehydrogenase accessory sulfurtransferase FdhD [Capsulimonadaceae bacterium]
MLPDWNGSCIGAGGAPGHLNHYYTLRPAPVRRTADAALVLLGMMNVNVRDVLSIEGDCPISKTDCLAVEEPLEIRLRVADSGLQRTKTVAITMRTPGNDSDLAAGFLFTEGIIHSAEDIASLDGCGDAVCVGLRPDIDVDWGRLERHFAVSSSCGVCGKTSLDAIRAVVPAPLDAGPHIGEFNIIHGLSEKLRAAQAAFDRTGGLHASGLFDSRGELLLLREDVGRHNALDKLIGAALLDHRVPLVDMILLVSGRASFELVQKALMAGIPILAAVGAPSSLAVEVARAASMTLLGFVRGGRFNIYCGAHRLGDLTTEMTV